MKSVIELKNKERIKDDLYKRENGNDIPKTKTKSIIDKIINPHYVRKPEDEILYLTKNETKSLIISRYGMLECGINFKGTMRPICTTCDVVDNEYHRLNECSRYASTNLSNNSEKIDFNLIYSSEIETIRSIIAKIKLVWNMKCANGSMHK